MTPPSLRLPKGAVQQRPSPSVQGCERSHGHVTHAGPCWSRRRTNELPFSDEVIDTLDELCAEKLPAHVLDRGREERERQAAERAKDREDRAWLKQQYAALESMSPDERQAMLAEHDERFGAYGGQRWQLEQRIRQLAETEAPKTEGADAAGSGEGGDAA